MEISEIKHKLLFRNVKALEERRSRCTTVTQLLSKQDLDLLEQLRDTTESMILNDFEPSSKKLRDILWRKVFYETISNCKRIWRKSGTLTEQDQALLKIFINNAIRRYKTLILQFENIFNLDIRFIINFTIIAEGAEPFEKSTEKEIYTAKEISHALENIHCFLISLGDLHRYCIEFKFCDDPSCAANYYWEAFKLQPKSGKPHNQLGTLYAGENFELKSIFHYLYSLCLLEPGESTAPLSEVNINKIFQLNYIDIEQNTNSTENFNTKEFIQNAIILIEIFFYDKDIEGFNSLCYGTIVSFKEYLNKCHRNSLHLDEKVVLLLTSIFMLCLYKLKLNKSPKVHNLNAFLIAFCAEIVDKTIDSIERFLEGSNQENEVFAEMYSKSYQGFEGQVKYARDFNTEMKAREKSKEKNRKVEASSLSQEGRVSSSDHQNSQSQTVKILKRSQGEEEKNPNSCSSAPLQKARRRRKRRGSSSSSDGSIASVKSGSDISMNSDFDSFDSDNDSVRFSSDDSYDEIQNRDDADFVIENEEIVYDNSDVVIEEEKMVFQDDQTEDATKLLKVRFKKRYNKMDPNLILNYCQMYSSWLQSLQILFYWLRINADILLDCYRTNPEFIKKIITLVNYINIDIFTRKIYFERSMITFKNLREHIRPIFDMRNKIATEVDNIFKKFPLFEDIQETIDWQLNCKLQITTEEDVLVRTFKIIDFGYFLCKEKKFNYNFCARSRVFIEKKNNPRFRERHEGRNGETLKQRRRNRKKRVDRRTEKSEVESDIEDLKSIQSTSRKGYLRNKESKKNPEDKSKMMEKMGKLWLKSEVDSLEQQSKPENGNLTPYLMVDTFALINYLYIVKNLIKSKKFIVLIPKAVLQDIDGLKKSKEAARNAIKWLESEFQKGNRFMRTQQLNEALTLPFLKFPTKLEREDTIFMNIVPFINFIVSNNSNDVENELPVLTFLTGENLDTKKSTAINKAGILQSIPVKYEPINRFYLKYKK